MISISYIKNGYEESLYCDPFSVYQRYSDTCFENIQESYKEFQTNTASIFLESEIMGNISEEQQLYLEKEKSNVFAKIGKTIMDLAKKFGELCDKLIQKIKDFSFSMKSNEKKMDQLLKEHPELSREKVKLLVAEGELELSDMKSLAELDKEFYKLMDLAKSKDVDPNSFRGKCKAFEEKLKSGDSKLLTAAKVATAVTTLALFLPKIKKTIAEANSTCKKLKAESNDRNSKLYEELQKASKAGKTDVKVEEMGKFQTLLAMNRLLTNKEAQLLKKNQGLIDKAKTNIAVILDKFFDKDGAKKIFGNINDNYQTNMKSSVKKRKKAEGEQDAKDIAKAVATQQAKDKAKRNDADQRQYDIDKAVATQQAKDKAKRNDADQRQYDIDKAVDTDKAKRAALIGDNDQVDYDKKKAYHQKYEQLTAERDFRNKYPQKNNNNQNNRKKKRRR